MSIREIRGGMTRLLLVCISWILLLANCKEEENQTPEQKLLTQGKGLYVTNCSACHNQNPAVDGAVGPAVKGRRVIIWLVRFGVYPGGYVPFTILAFNNSKFDPLTAGPTAPSTAGF
ncbi:c-type cytochrome [Leptospira yasudae]|uniref:c-type cytochrome n=1 Tax=Leptospira yasudae TaxID=2202201 RepID=UPI003CD0DE29